MKAIAAENIDQVVHVDHVRDFHAEFLDECMAKWKITTIVIGGGRACWKKSSKKTLTRKTLDRPFFSNLDFTCFAPSQGQHTAHVFLTSVFDCKMW